MSHGIDLIFKEDETWRVICECAWEAWNQPSEDAARSLHALHVVNPVPNDPRCSPGGRDA